MLHPRESRVVMAVLAGVVSASLHARDLDQDEALALRRSGELLPFEAIYEVVARRHPGANLLEVELEQEHGIYLYEIEVLLDDGTVREVEVDARTGAILQDELED